MKAIPRLVVILDSAGCILPIEEVAGAAISGGADMVQVREKDLSEDKLSSLLENVIDRVGGPEFVTVNSAPRLAAIMGTHLHLPEGFESDAGEIALTPDRLLSRSIHPPVNDVEGIEADYLILGNVFETDSKPGKIGIGVGALESVIRSKREPIIAIGGIAPENVGNVLAAGAYGVAVRSFIIGSSDPEQATRAIREEIDKWTSQ